MSKIIIRFKDGEEYCLNKVSFQEGNRFIYTLEKAVIEEKKIITISRYNEILVFKVDNIVAACWKDFEKQFNERGES